MLCQDCWQAFNPGSYAPEGDEFGICEDCGNPALLYPRDADAFDEPGDLDADIEDLAEDWA